MRNIKETLNLLTLEEKAGLCSGSSFWFTKAIERLGIDSIKLSDGPHGVRSQVEGGDHLGINASQPATCFPSGAGLAASWDKDLIGKVGETLGEEAGQLGVSVLLGPAVNIKRSPLCGRNFEYFSEDPYLSGQLAVAHINGVQSKGIGTSIKHFAVNNQEDRRFSVSAEIDERTMREIYLPAFEEAVKLAKPWTVMCAYNQVNGEYCSDNEYLLTDILRKEWGFDGVVVSDWGAVNDRVQGIKAGMDLEMPSSGGMNDKKIIEAVNNGTLSVGEIDIVVERLLKLVNKSAKGVYGEFDKVKHHTIAQEIAAECVVLLKNNDVLPIDKDKTVFVTGEFAEKARFQGGGSSHINPTFVDSPMEELRKKGVKLNENTDTVVVFAGLPDSYESEGFDREHMRMPDEQSTLIFDLCKKYKNVVVVLSNGSPVEMPWADNVQAIVEGYLGGQGFGKAIADILVGDKNPSGKLAETFPIKLEDNPSFLNFPGEGDIVKYKEDIFVGYRYYEKKKMPVLFPFGHGLSYTNFEYKNISLDKPDINDTDTLTVSITVKNIGSRTGKEIVQLYVCDTVSHVIRSVKELKGFSKIELQPNEEKIVNFTLDKRSFAFYKDGWKVETGEFEILVGSSSVDIRLKETVMVHSTDTTRQKFTMNSCFADIMADPIGAKIVEQMQQDMVKHSPQVQEMSDNSSADLGMDVQRMFGSMTLRNLLMFSGEMLTVEIMQGILDAVNNQVQQS